MPVNLLQDPDFSNNAAAPQAPTNLLADPDFVGNVAPSQPFSLGSFLMSGLNNLGQGGLDALSGMAKAGMGIANAPHNIVNLFSPRMAAKIPTSPINEGDINQIFGTQNPSALGKLQEAAGQYAPYGAAAELLGGGLLGNAAAGGAYGATQSQNPLAEAGKGAAINAGLSLIPAGVGLAAKGMGYLKPGDYADQIINQLSGGRSLEENSQSLAGDIKNAFTNRVNQGQAQYKPIFDAVGANNIYEGMIPENSSYQSLDKDIPDSYNRNLNKLHQQFMTDPTFQNAHLLQSQLGSSIRKLQAADAKSNLTVADTSTLQGYQEAQDALRTDMGNFLNGKNPALANQYQSATQNWAQNVAPYFDNPKISQMAKGELTNPASIANIFKNPEPEIQKVAGDLGDAANNKILYSILGKTNATKSPENLVTAFKQLNEQGLSSYVPPSLQQQISSLGNRIKARNLSQSVVGGLLGLGATRPLAEVLPTNMMEPAAIAGGAVLGRSLGKIMPNVSASPDLLNALMKIYGAGVPGAVLPNVVGGQ